MTTTKFSSILCLIFLLFIGQTTLSAQEKQYKVGALGFYNLENLFDLVDDTLTRDDDFTPDGELAYTEKIYNDKLDRLSDVVAQMGTDVTPDGVAILGVSEIENRAVLEDFVRHKNVRDRNYQIIHFDSPDKRGIDVGMIYQPKYFEVTHSRPIHYDLVKPNGDTVYTRDILYVEGIFDQEKLHVLVNHWPSRSGGEAATRSLRNHAADLCKSIVDSLEAIDPHVKIVIMGDLNDDPTSPSVRSHLNAQPKLKKLVNGEMYNPMHSYYKKGMGTTAYRDAWSLFDQMIVSRGLTNEKQPGYRFYKASIFNKRFIIQPSGRFKGYPWRTYSFGQYIGGFSDHFPVMVYLVKEI